LFEFSSDFGIGAKRVASTVPALARGASQNIFRHFLHFALIFPASRPLISTQHKASGTLVWLPIPTPNAGPAFSFHSGGTFSENRRSISGACNQLDLQSRQ
jgi:hypothetical protein